MFYVQKHMAALAMCHNPPMVHDKPQGVLASVQLVYGIDLLNHGLILEMQISGQTSISNALAKDGYSTNYYL